MDENHVEAIVPAIRGALARFVSAPTVLVEEAPGGHDEDGGEGALEVETRGEPAGAAELVAAIQAYVERNGGVPRRIAVAGGPRLVVGSTLSVADERVVEPLLSEEQVAGRDGIVGGRVAVVTGGAQGFGEEIVRSLVAHGARVFIADLNLEGAVSLSEELNAQAGSVTRPLRVDVSSEESVEAMVRDVVALAGGVDLLVSNAGVLKAGSVKELSAADFEFVTRVNYTGFFLCTKFVSRVMEAQNRTAPPDRYTDIIQINSKSGLAGSNRNGAYAGGKFGGIGLVQSFALELVADRVKVNAICPGNFFEGPLWSDPDRGLFVQYLNAGKVAGAKSVADVKAHYEAQVPMKRGCRGEDVMRAMLYLVDQRYETGQAVPVTGGQIMLS
ncbi:MAG: SDR family NAD(P)-dependent oxidoreductase [Spirochaetota bacterium]